MFYLSHSKLALRQFDQDVNAFIQVLTKRSHENLKKVKTRDSQKLSRLLT